MRYKVFATDYDGTLAKDERVSTETIQQLQRLKASGRICILVTGRELKDLLRIFPQYELFDRIVAENGALVYRPDTGEEKILAEPPPMSFIKELQLAGVQPLSVGKVIVATWEPHHLKVLEIIKKSGIERQVIFNKGAVMILPPGINKATGLKAALQEMNLTYHNVVAVGDAENDSHLLQMAECGVAVNNALPPLKQLADWTTKKSQGEGVQELIGKLLTDDLRELDVILKKHYIQLGRHPDETPFKISPYSRGVLVTGKSMAGKTTLAAAFLEQLLDHQYQFCLIDPEGDYDHYEGSPAVIRVGDADHAPEVKTIVALLKNPGQSCLVCLVAVPMEKRHGFFRKLANLLVQEQALLGHPHWLILDEVHHLLGTVPEPPFLELPEYFKNFMMLTTSPDLVNPVLLRQVDIVLVPGKNAQNAIQLFATLTGRLAPTETGTDQPLQGQALVWDCLEKLPPFLIDTLVPTVHLQRHKRKYAKGDLKEHSFYFNGPKGLQLKARNLADFIQISGQVDGDTWEYHLQRHDYSSWFGGAIGDQELARAARTIEAAGHDSEASREEIKKLVEENYTGPVE
jgi:hydroxymethylpyrimidine pyrophosphatase-like HAD family hydrolase